MIHTVHILQGQIQKLEKEGALCSKKRLKTKKKVVSVGDSNSSSSLSTYFPHL